MIFKVIGKKFFSGIFNGFAYKTTHLFLTYESDDIEGCGCEIVKLKGFIDVEVGQEVSLIIDESNKITGVSIA